MSEEKCAYPNCDCDTEIMCTMACNSVKQIEYLRAELERLDHTNRGLIAKIASAVNMLEKVDESVEGVLKPWVYSRKSVIYFLLSTHQTGDIDEL